MKQAVEFEECLKDSPLFRLQVDQNEHDINELEGALEKLIKLCNGMVETGTSFKTSTCGLAEGIDILTKFFEGDQLVSSTLHKFSWALSELQSYLAVLLEQAQRSIASSLLAFKDEVKKVKETKKLFDRISDDLDNALNKNAQLQRNCRPSDAEEAKNIVTAMYSCFDHTALDYAFQINILQSRRRIDILVAILNFMYGQSTYFHQGYDLMSDLDSYMRKVSKELEGLSAQFTVDKKEMEERHSLVQKMEESGGLRRRQLDDPSGLVMEGYLFKRSSNAFRSWQRRYFTVRNNQLMYQKRLKDDLTVLAEDLRLCKVRPTEEPIERRFVFEVVSPTKSWILQADNDYLKTEWMEAMQASINKAFGCPTSGEIEKTETDSLSSGTKSKSVESLDKLSEPKSVLEQIRSVLGNDKCADCGKVEPSWASTNWGVVLCIECSGIHRSLGVHVSKVRSLTLDAWEPEQIKLMTELGNELVNGILEAKARSSLMKKPLPQGSRTEREAWIKAKYLHRKFASLEVFLSNCQRLDKGIIRNLARMKVHHEEKAVRAPERSNSKKSRIFKRKHALKVNKSKMDNRKSAPPKVLLTDVTSDDHESLEKIAASYLEQSSSDKAVSSDSHDEGSSDGIRRPRAASTSGIGDRVNSIDSSDDGHLAEDTAEVELNEEESLRQDKGKAIAVLKRIYPSRLLFKAAEWKSLPLMAAALAEGAKVNWVNEDVESKTALHQSILGGSLSACEFLLQNGAKINQKDKRGRGALHHAALLGQTGPTLLFLKRGGNQHDVDENGEDPLTIAVKQMHADIVTLLRLARLNDEMRESDEISQGDNTFSDVFRDFSNMASKEPDRLQRKFDSKDPNRQTPV
ncbi:arf-GAP with coiled-coil, ANK repeat and PH domain-containing protein 2-like [Acropora muricata]|uniref:arf-GAP with coiled-coil, ANK repeat and PH domain-containing protein 2-like n=1 Tax=Acropora millepora TaxID=45264 RepID=UPI001CF4352B|nr:arf-GAP with coiled-coil, ANK repeat and PH domain-containing protein 2-like [Acropora millepora]